MATYDELTSSEREKLMRILRNPGRLPRRPRQDLPKAAHYEYDFKLKQTVEVTRSGQRFPVTLVGGKLLRDSAKAPPGKEKAG